MDKNITIRILQLKNNFYWDDVKVGRKALGEFCVIGYFDAFDISEEKLVKGTEFNTWGYLGELTSLLDGTVNCRMLVCITEQKQKDKEFWEDRSAPLYFITMVRVKAGMSADDMEKIINSLQTEKNQISYLSYDHSEIIVFYKTNQYSEGIRRVKMLRDICEAVKTYTVFTMMEGFLESYNIIADKITDEKVFGRLHCMVKNYQEAESFRLQLEQQLGSRSSGRVEIRRFDTFGGYDWLMEFDNVSICSLLECYKMGNLLTHSNETYNKAFFNVESEILAGVGREEDSYVDRGTENAAKGNIH